MSINNIDLAEVQSVSVLKDASATAVFGVKGANGVILVTTKKGELGKPRLNISANTTIKTLSRIPNYLGSYDALDLKNRAIEYESMTNDRYWRHYMPYDQLNYYKTQEYPYLYPDVNWSDWMVEDYALSNRINMNIRGGTNFVKYFTSLSHVSEGDILKTTDYGQGYDPDYKYDRFNFRTNLDFNLGKTTKFSANISGYHGIRQEVKRWAHTNFWHGVYGAPPDLFPAQHADGSFGHNAFWDVSNPVAELNFGGLTRSNTTDILTDFDLSQQLDFITKGLTFDAKFSYNNRFESSGPDLEDYGIWTKYIDPSILNAQNAADSLAAVQIKSPPLQVTEQSGYDYVRKQANVEAEAGLPNSIFRRTSYQFALNYKRKFGLHDVTALALLKRNENASGSAFTSYREDWVSRVTYAYDRKYLLDVNFAYNGSEKFAKDYRFGFFPSAAAGWTISNEKFFSQNIQFVNLLKIRYSIGTSGSDDGIPRWLYVNSWAKRGGRAWFGYPSYTQGDAFWAEGNIAVPDAHWETALKRNLGIDIGLLGNSISFVIDFFNEHRRDIFLSANNRNLPPWFGANPVPANLGETKTQGWEFEANYVKVSRNTFNYWFKGNYNFAKDEVIYREDPLLMPEYRKQAGYQIGQTRTTVVNDMMHDWNDIYTSTLGEVNTYLLPGTFNYVDFNADGVINQDDVVPYGYPNNRPQYSYSLSSGFSYKGFSCMVQFYGVHNISRNIRMGEFGGGLSVARPFHLYDSWSPENAFAATYPHVRYMPDASYGSYWIKDGSYVRLKTAEISYTLKSRRISNIGIQNVKLFVNGNDLFLWTRMIEDREGGSYEQTNYPMVKRYNIGLNFNF
jgi:TonB-linked SusC/RagA family outer membrane protein